MAHRVSYAHATTCHKYRATKPPLGAHQSSVDDLGGVLLRIYDGDHHDRISLLDFSSDYYRRFFAVERTFYLSTRKRKRSSMGRV